MNAIKFTFCLALMIVMGCSPSNSTFPVFTVSPNDFLSAAKFDNLVVEIEYVSGYQPSATAATNLQDFLKARVNKTNVSVKVNAAGINSPSKLNYGLEDLNSIESSIRTTGVSGTTLSIYIFFADGGYMNDTGSSKTLGLTYTTSSVAIFEKTIKSLSGGVGQPSIETLETTVLLHETGHILGLVNDGTPLTSQHEDSSHAKHCNDTNCLMYFQVDNSDFIANLTGGNIPTLNAACLNDLKGNGGK